MTQKPNILVVDDDARWREVLTIFLASRNWNVISANDGQAALDQFHQHPADLVILDVMMPVMDGWELCQQLRQISDVPIMVLTARGQDNDRKKGLQLGADDYLVKPVTLREIETHVAGLLQHSR